MRRKDVLFGLIAAISLAAAFSPFASSSPDGLEKTAMDKGFFEKKGEMPLFRAPFAGYALPCIKNKGIAVSLAGIGGVLFVFCAAYGVGVILRRRGSL